MSSEPWIDGFDIYHINKHFCCYRRERQRQREEGEREIDTGTDTDAQRWTDRKFRI